jgi:hypothetical protein
MPWRRARLPAAPVAVPGPISPRNGTFTNNRHIAPVGISAADHDPYQCAALRSYFARAAFCILVRSTLFRIVACFESASGLFRPVPEKRHWPDLTLSGRSAQFDFGRGLIWKTGTAAQLTVAPVTSHIEQLNNGVKTYAGTKSAFRNGSDGGAGG